MVKKHIKLFLVSLRMPKLLWQHTKMHSLVMSKSIQKRELLLSLLVCTVGPLPLSNFAKMYASKFGVDESKMMERLWGENYFDPTTKKWTTKHTGSATCHRGFVQFCYEPIKQIINTCMNDQKDKL